MQDEHGARMGAHHVLLSFRGVETSSASERSEPPKLVRMNGLMRTKLEAELEAHVMCLGPLIFERAVWERIHDMPDLHEFSTAVKNQTLRFRRLRRKQLGYFVIYRDSKKD